MKKHYRQKAAEYVDADFADALNGSKHESLSSGRQAQRKAQQYCRQVQRALNLALPDCISPEDLSSVFVEEVSPAPDCGHLLVQVLIPADHQLAHTMSALRRVAPHLRSEVARTVNRKRAPELSFIPVSGEEHNDE